MLAVQDLRAGTFFKLDGQPFAVLKYEHIKMGRGSATIKVKVRNVKTGAVLEKSFINSASVESANIERVQLQFLYRDGSSFVFMNPITFDQIEVGRGAISGQEAYLVEGEKAGVLLYEGDPIGLELPPKMKFKVVECDPGVRGDSATNLFKSAKLENGMAVKVPLFIKEQEVVVVDTRTGEDVERAK